jgi:hypothetical protein
MGIARRYQPPPYGTETCMCTHVYQSSTTYPAKLLTHMNSDSQQKIVSL